MKNKRHPAWFPLILMIPVFLVLVSGCARLGPQADPALDQKAHSLATDVRSQNQGVTASTGTGWVELETDSRKERFKIAWAATAPNLLRLTFLVSGHPVETIVATGAHVSFISHTRKHKPHTTLSSDPDLKKFIHVPIKLSEMIAILLGQIPVQPFDQAWFKPENSGFSSLILAKKWRSTLQQLYTDKAGRVQQLSFLDENNNLLYGITYLDYQAYEKFFIPVTLLIQDVQGRKIHVTLTRFVPNPPIKASVFRLTESGS